MRNTAPPRPQGIGPDARFFQWVYDSLMGFCNLIDSPSIGIQRGTRGTSLIIKPQKGVAAPAAATLERFTFVSARADYIIAQPHGTVAASARVNIAKPPELRLSITQAVIDGTLITYSTAAYNTAATQFFRRDAVKNGVTEKQVIVPRYLPVSAAVGSLPAQAASTIYAMKVQGGTGVLSDVVTGSFPIGSTVEYLEISSRAWAAKADQST